MGLKMFKTTRNPCSEAHRLITWKGRPTPKLLTIRIINYIQILKII